MNTKTTAIFIAVCAVVCIALGAMWHKGCSKPVIVTETHRDTIRTVKTELREIPVTRWRTVTRTESRIDTAYVVADGGSEPESGEPVADFAVDRKALLVHQGGESNVEWTDRMTVGYAGRFSLDIDTSTIIFTDQNLCTAITADTQQPHGIWTDVLFWLGGIAVGSILIAILTSGK